MNLQRDLMIPFIAAVAALHGMAAAGSPDAGSAGPSLSPARQALRKGTPEEIRLVQAELTARLQTSSNRWEISQACLDLSAAPTDEAILVLVGRLRQPASQDLMAALCRGLGRLLQARLPVSNVTQQHAAPLLLALAESPRSSSGVVEASMLAIASMRGDGLDLLLDLRKRRARPADSFFTCLAATRDPRALAELRSSWTDPAVTSGQRVEIVHAIGQMFLAARLDGTSITTSEREACSLLIQSVLADGESSEQLHSAALRALVQISPQDGRVRSILRHSLAAGSDAQREGALDAVYQEDGPSDPETLQVVRALAESEAIRPDFRETARAILCKNDVEACQDVH